MHTGIETTSFGGGNNGSLKVENLGFSGVRAPSDARGARRLREIARFAVGPPGTGADGPRVGRPTKGGPFPHGKIHFRHGFSAIAPRQNAFLDTPHGNAFSHFTFGTQEIIDTAALKLPHL